jgi:hypothetical protein
MNYIHFTILSILVYVVLGQETACCLIKYAAAAPDLSYSVMCIRWLLSLNGRLLEQVSKLSNADESVLGLADPAT